MYCCSFILMIMISSLWIHRHSTWQLHKKITNNLWQFNVWFNTIKWSFSPKRWVFLYYSRLTLHWHSTNAIYLLLITFIYYITYLIISIFHNRNLEECIINNQNTPIHLMWWARNMIHFLFFMDHHYFALDILLLVS